jgi:ActR/RegA family two-component response regulator
MLPMRGPGAHATSLVGAVLDMPTPLRSLNCEAIERTLAALGGNGSATAKALGISRNTIDRLRQSGSGQAG